MNCPRCGALNSGASPACSLCGQALNSPAPKSPPAGFPFSPCSASSQPPASDPRRAPIPTPVFDPAAARLVEPAFSPEQSRDLAVEQAGEARRDRTARIALIGVGVLAIFLFSLFIWTRRPLSDSKVDEMYSEYCMRAPNAEFPPGIEQAFQRRKITRDLLFQLAHAHEAMFGSQDALGALASEERDRLASIQAGQGDPAHARAQAEGDASLDGRIQGVESVMSNVYNAGPKPFDTLREAGGLNESGAEMRGLEEELVSGREEMQERYLQAEMQRRHSYYDSINRNIRQVYEEAIRYGTPQTRSIARRLNQRLYGETP